MIELPDAFWEVRYVGVRYPGSPAVRKHPGLAEGANCQLFAYEVLRHFGLTPPDLRPSELWSDTLFTRQVTTPRPLDLVFHNPTRDPWGAHIGLWSDPDQVLHLCPEVRRPTLWTLPTFASHPRYQTLLGYKRLTP